ncbi:MAG: cyclopropane-fatty-acyl-phospholipid synthase [Sphingomonas fennica]
MSLVDHFLKKAIRRGELTVIFADGKIVKVGTPDAEARSVTIRFTDAKVPGFIAANPHLRAAEAYMDGRLVIEEGDVRDLITLIRINGRFEEGRERAIGGTLTNLVKDMVRQASHTVNDARRSKQNVAHHYDIGNRLYDLFLDRDRQYSCAYWTDPDGETLDQAQEDKKAHIAAKLDLRPGQRVLDIGCGWGGMALYLNRVAGVDVLGITLSEEQLKMARERAAAAGVADRVKFELIDYRAIQGQTFDRIVSVGMFEHVGTHSYVDFFRQAKALLADDGVMLLHTIGRMGNPGRTDEFTRKYIFPGGYNPALSEVVEASQKVRLIVSDVEVLRLHYAHTIAHWYERTVAERDAIVALYDERFYRMWTFYLAGAEGAFRYGNLVNFQIQYIKNRTALPITRDYMAEAEARYRAA